jgi:hypothetical protein
VPAHLSLILIPSPLVPSSLTARRSHPTSSCTSIRQNPWLLLKSTSIIIYQYPSKSSVAYMTFSSFSFLTYLPLTIADVLGEVTPQYPSKSSVAVTPRSTVGLWSLGRVDTCSTVGIISLLPLESGITSSQSIIVCFYVQSTEQTNLVLSVAQHLN